MCAKRTGVTKILFVLLSSVFVVAFVNLVFFVIHPVDRYL
jgi:hypothetical protein